MQRRTRLAIAWHGCAGAGCFSLVQPHLQMLSCQELTCMRTHAVLALAVAVPGVRQRPEEWLGEEAGRLHHEDMLPDDHHLVWHVHHRHGCQPPGRTTSILTFCSSVYCDFTAFWHQSSITSQCGWTEALQSHCRASCPSGRQSEPVAACRSAWRRTRWASPSAGASGRWRGWCQASSACSPRPPSCTSCTPRSRRRRPTPPPPPARSWRSWVRQSRVLLSTLAHWPPA